MTSKGVHLAVENYIFEKKNQYFKYLSKRGNNSKQRLEH